LLNDSVAMAYEFWPEDPKSTWHGMSVCAIDGSAFDLPATEEIRKEFDPNSGLQHAGKGHYPQCLVSTAFDVFRRLPIARTVVPVNSSERDEVKHLLEFIPLGSVLLFDRGYPSYELIRHLVRKFQGFFVFRCPAHSTFPAVQAFIESGKAEDQIHIAPTANFLRKVPKGERKELETVKLRIIKLVSPDGTVSVLLTNLADTRIFPLQELVSLYLRRWEVENYYRDEKIVLEIEKFHGKSGNSIRQELLAAMIMSVIARTLVVLSKTPADATRPPQFKNAIMTLAAEAAVLAADDPASAIGVFEEILHEIRRVINYPRKKPRPSPTRVTKRRLNKWAISKTRKVVPTA